MRVKDNPNNIKALAKELLDNFYYDGMVFVIYSDGETEITTQTESDKEQEAIKELSKDQKINIFYK